MIGNMMESDGPFQIHVNPTQVLGHMGHTCIQEDVSHSRAVADFERICFLHFSRNSKRPLTSVGPTIRWAVKSGVGRKEGEEGLLCSYFPFPYFSLVLSRAPRSMAFDFVTVMARIRIFWAHL